MISLRNYLKQEDYGQECQLDLFMHGRFNDDYNVDKTKLSKRKCVYNFANCNVVFQ